MQRVRIYLIAVHIAGWLLFMAFPILFLNGGGETGKGLLLLSSPFYWLFCFTYIILFYINAYFFIPWLFLKREYFKYAFIIIFLYAGIYFLRPYDRLLRNNEDRDVSGQQGPPPMDSSPFGNHRPPPGNGIPPNDQHMRHHPPEGPPPYPDGPPPHFGPGDFGRHGLFVDTTSLFIFIMIIALSTAIKVIRQWQVTEQRAALAEADKASAELSFLKAQINPHFLFNTLNNIYTLAVIKDDNAPDSIMKLSNIMRYVTDDATEDFVPLQNELDCINDYIELQRLRTGEKTIINVSFSGTIEQKKIAPLVLMTFIENVFKYGISKHEWSVISITVLAAEKNILFFCENTIFSENKQTERSGIGLKNTMKRLEHLYPGKHMLVITNENGLYTVNLTLQTL
jgi:two-component system LytT family sensor kinase